MRKVDIRTLRKWRHYAAHAKKFRTRKKYKRKWNDHLRRALSWMAPWYAAKITEMPMVTPELGIWARAPYFMCRYNEFLYSETELAGMRLIEKRRK